jgi:hypothetical protein
MLTRRRLSTGSVEPGLRLFSVLLILANLAAFAFLAAQRSAGASTKRWRPQE